MERLSEDHVLPDVRKEIERMMTFLWVLLVALAAVLIVLISSALVLSILLIVNVIKDIFQGVEHGKEG